MEKTREQVPAAKGHLRHVVALLLLSGVVLNYIIKVMLSVAIVAMVKRQSSSSSSATNTTTDDTCPGDIEDDSQDRQDGPFDWDEVVQGQILSAYFYGYVATQFLGGWVAGRLGARWVFGLGLLVTGIFSILSPEAAKLDRYVFMALRALQGAGSGMILPSTNVLISKWYTLEERPQIAGFILSANSGGSFISMGLSGVLVDAMGWSSVFYVFGGVCLLYLLPFSYFVYSSPETHPRISSEERDHILHGRQKGDLEEKVDTKQVSLPTPWLSILACGQFWIIVSVFFGLTWLNYTLLTELPTYISNVLHVSMQKMGIISSLPYLFAWVSGGVFGSLSSWLRSTGRLSQMTAYRLFTGTATVGSAFFLLLVVFMGCNTVAVICCFVATVAMTSSFYGGAVTQHLDLAPNFAGVISGILYTVMNSPGIIAPQVIGVVLKNQPGISGWHIVFYMAMAVVITPYIVYLLFSSDREQSWNKPQAKTLVSSSRESCVSCT